MIIDAMGLIMADNTTIRLGELTRPRALAAVPFAGRYRIIDFMLSNMVNSGIISVGVLTSNKYKSLMDHLGNGAAWDLSRKNKGLFILPPFITSEMYGCGINGDIDGLSGILDFFKMNNFKYIIVADSNVVFNSSFNGILAEHEESGADISVLYNRDNITNYDNALILETDRKNWIKNLYKNSGKPVSNKTSLGVFVMRRELLIDLIMEAIARGEHDFALDVLIRKHDKLKLRGFEFKGVAMRINSVKDYYATTMRLLNENVREELFMAEQRIFTKVKDEAPSLYSSDCVVNNSLISDGCQIMGEVTNSMLFRGVTVSKNTVIKNSIIMQNVHISEGCYVENTIIDKNSMLRPGIKLIGQADYPVVIGKGANV